jgi:hypothetical protein
MTLVALALIVALIIGHRRQRVSGPHLLVLPGKTPEEVWMFNVRDMRAAIRPRKSLGARALEQWELGRSTDGIWQMRPIPLEPPELPLLFPTHGLRPPRRAAPTAGDKDDAGSAPPYRRATHSDWVECEELMRSAIEQAHQRYNEG